MTDERIVAYLLEELSEEEAERFEEECFTGESVSLQLDVVEEDLIEDYLRGALSPERRQRFERNYLTTKARLERVRMAAALLRHVDERAAEQEESVKSKEAERAARSEDVLPGGWFHSLWNMQAWAGRAALVLIAVAALAGAWWLSRPRIPQQKIVALLTLSMSNSDRAEGAQVSKVKLTPDIGSVKLSLTLPQESPAAIRRRVVLEDESGDKKSLEAAAQDTQSVSVEIPASQLKPGMYAVKLFAVQSDGTEQRIRGSYFFMVE